MRVRLELSYDGTEFFGWAVQPGRRTVQGVLQETLAMVLRLPSVRLTVAGRTDAGVHASGQVAHLDLPAATWSAAADRLVYRLAAVLPSDVRVRSVAAAPAEFDARFSALWRRYEYRVCDAEGGVEPLRRRQVLAWRRPLDATAMAAAAQTLLGLNDFVAFCKWRAGATTIRSLVNFDVARDGVEIVCRVQADAFCHSMVRSLVGALIAVGDGRQAAEWPAALLTRSARADEITVAPAHGLRLIEVGYPPDDQLAARARQTRAKRSAEQGRDQAPAAGGQVRGGLPGMGQPPADE